MTCSFHLAEGPEYPSFLRLKKIPLYVDASGSFSIPLCVDMWVLDSGEEHCNGRGCASILRNVASNSYGCNIRSEMAPSHGKSISSFGGNSAPCSMADGPFYIFTDIGPGFQCLQILPNTSCSTVFGFWGLLVIVVDGGHPNGCDMICLCSLICFL